MIKRKQFLIFGASTEWGAWDIEGGGWPERLKRQLFKDESDSGKVEYDFHNLSISGNTSRDILKRFDFEAKQRIDGEYYKSLTIIFAVGTNDAVFLSEKEFRKNIIRLIRQAKKYTGKIFFKGLMRADERLTTPVAWNKKAFYYNENLEIYDQILKEVCAAEGIGYIQMHDLLRQGDLADGLHPNARGHKKIYGKVKSFLLSQKVI